MKPNRFSITRSICNNFEKSSLTVEYELEEGDLPLKESILTASRELYQLLITQSVCSNLLDGPDARLKITSSNERHDATLSRLSTKRLESQLAPLVAHKAKLKENGKETEKS